MQIKRKTGTVLLEVPGESLFRAKLSTVNLSWADLDGADLREADLRYVNIRSACLHGADLRGADFRYAYLRGVDLREANLRETNLSYADLGFVDLRDADLQDSNLYGADFKGADLTGVKGLPMVPIVPNIDQKILEALEQGGQLDMDDWHSCSTTHCRAGWAVHLAGSAGYDLEAITTPYLAGRLIYEASRPGVPAPDFFATNSKVMEDLKSSAAAYA